VKQILLVFVSHTCMALASGQTNTQLFELNQKILETNARSSLAHYAIGEIYFSQNNYQSAANEFREALNGDLEPEWTAVWSHIYLAEIFHLTGQEDRASNEYWNAEFDTSGALDSIAESKPAKAIKARYTEEAQLAELEGTVSVGGRIGADGSVKDLAVRRRLGLGLDEQVLDIAEQESIAEGASQRRYVAFEAYFFLPSKQSRWHLIRAAFETPDGASRPSVVRSEYPQGNGLIAPEAIEEGRVVTAARRLATASIRFEVSEQGIPINLQIHSASAEIWGTEAMTVVSKWRFAPGLKGGKAISVPCVFDLVWGPRTLAPSMVVRLREKDNSQPDGKGFGVASATIPAKDVAGKTLVLGGHIKTEAETRGWVGLWLRVDGRIVAAEPVLDKAAPEPRWKRYALTFPVPVDAKSVSFGALHTGDGTAWFEGLSIELDGVPYVPEKGLSFDLEVQPRNGFLPASLKYQVEWDTQTVRMRRLVDSAQ
jgi:hypothetical protein